METLTGLEKVVGKDALRGIARQMLQEDQQLGIQISFMAQGKRNTALTVTEGFQILKDKSMKMPKEEDLRSLFFGTARDAFTGLTAGNIGDNYEAFKAFYAAKASQRGMADGVVDKKLAQESFKAVVGETTKISGNRIVLPEGFSEEKLRDTIKAITPAMIRSMGGVYGMSDEEAAEFIRDDAEWEMTQAPGVYRVVVGGKYLRTADFRNYVQFRFGR
ncbi:MAG: hypothetical protein IT388_06505 [Nitrospirales bacterium]|nr:hypothetical protein [Nitrospirales bacterium]